MIKITKLQSINEIEIYNDDDGEDAQNNIDAAEFIVNGKNTETIEFKNYIIKKDFNNYVFMLDGDIVGIFFMEEIFPADGPAIKGGLEFRYRWVSPSMRGKGMYFTFLEFLKRDEHVSCFYSDAIMSDGAVKSTLKLQGKYKVEFINSDTGEVQPVNNDTISKYITRDYSDESVNWRFRIKI